MTGSSPGKENFAVASAPGQKPKITSIFDFSAEALGQLRLWLEQNPPAIGISNILGFSQFTAKQSPVIATSETRSSATYGDLATAGPSLTMLPDGQYVVLFGATMNNGAGVGDARMSVQINSTAATDTDSILFSGGAFNISLARIVIESLAAGGNNTVTAKYRGDGVNNSTFLNRWLIALRFANK